MSFDPRPRRIWLGGSVPGKKMVKMLIDMGFLTTASEIFAMYQEDSAKTVLIFAAAVLREIPVSAPFGPAARNLTRTMLPGDFHGAILTDIRDFLKLRFRASGLKMKADDQALMDLKQLPTEISESPGALVSYVIGALDDISRDREGRMKLHDLVYFLADTLTRAANLLDTQSNVQAPRLD